ncbi:GAF and ANTAR domain-containing protein [Kitasatospora paracochleata]|uniref:GAF domain-containing protein n=1 Tax=Kitasatospora paracochleata TaxID=58354 RepID=A0ABT1J484_9ACTN|nr:GAF and ANTAR domain-containing protein [Kitasatospora paracochleata]MCP2311881.1 GAF domain-containing protein [Kitasatospora paracochleata]
MGRQSELNEAFASLTESLVGDFDLAELLDRLAAYCVTLCAAGGAGIVVVDKDGVLRDVAWSSEAVRRLERRQLELGEGPCIDCVRLGRAVIEPDLSAASARWPVFAHRAREAGFNSVRALPLRMRNRTLGALNLFDIGSANETTTADLRSAQVFADLAVLAVHHHRALPPELAGDNITRVLADRSVIERAKGMIAEAADLTPDEACARLLAHARRTVQGPTEVAAALVAGALAPTAVLGPVPDEE